MPIATTGAFPKHFDKRISKIFYDEQTMRPPEYTSLFKIEDAPAGNDYREARLSGLGPLLSITEGRGVEYDVPVEGDEKTRTYSKFGRGFMITEEMYKDDVFQNFRQLPKALSKSANYTLEVQAANVLNNGFSTASVGMDGKALFDNNHTTLKSGTTINNLGSADLSTTSLQAAFDVFNGMVNDSGFPAMLKPKRLVIPYQSAWVANDLSKATGRVWDYARINSGDVGSSGGTAGFPAADAMNTLNPSNGIVDGWDVFVSHYLSDSDSWFLFSDEADLRMLFKERVRMQSYDDFDTGAMKFKATTRFVPFCNRYWTVFGSPGS